MRHMIIITTFVAAGAATALGGYWVGRVRPVCVPGQTSSTEGVNDNAVEPIALTEKLLETIALLDRRLAALEAKQLGAKPSDPPASDSPDPQRLAERLDPAAIMARQLESTAAIEEALRTQPRDAAWASATEGELRNAVDTAAREGAQFSLKTLRCLTSICEMVISASGPDQLGHTSFQLDPHISGMSGFEVSAPEAAADGSATVTYRLFRKGYARPDDQS